MAIRSSFFNSVNGDRRYLAYNFAEYFASFIGNGVFANPSNAFQVYEKENMIVNVKAGKAWINGYIAVNDGDYNLTITNADGVLNRIDRIVLRLDFNVRAINIAVKKGTFASTPVAPTLQRDAEVYELVLADVYVGKGITRITQSNITDQRMNKALCGVVKGTVDQIDTTDLFNQYGSAFQEWFETVKNYLNDTAVGNVANKLAEHELNKGAHGLGVADLNTTAKTIREAINEVFTSGNNVKKNVVDTLLSLDSTLPITINSGWSNIISALPNVSGKSAMNVFIQPTQPTTKDGIWFKTSQKPDVEDYKYDVFIETITQTTLPSISTYAGTMIPINGYIYTLTNGALVRYDPKNNLYTNILTDSRITHGDMRFTSIGEDLYIIVGAKSLLKYNVTTTIKAEITIVSNYNLSFIQAISNTKIVNVESNATHVIDLTTLTTKRVNSPSSYIYSFTGYKNNFYLKDSTDELYKFNASTETWSSFYIPSHPLPGGVTGLAQVNDTDFYQLGGYANKPATGIYRHMSFLGVWSQIGDLPFNTSRVTSVVEVDSVIYSHHPFEMKFHKIAPVMNNYIKGVNIDRSKPTYSTSLLNMKGYNSLKKLPNTFSEAYISLDGKTKLRGIDTYYGNGASWLLTNIK